MAAKTAVKDNTCYIFMNHHVHEKKATEPMVTIQRANGQRIYCNELRIEGECVVKTGENHDITTHVVKAYIECAFEDVEVIA